MSFKKPYDSEQAGREQNAVLSYGLGLHKRCMKGELTGEQCIHMMREFEANCPEYLKAREYNLKRLAELEAIHD